MTSVRSKSRKLANLLWPQHGENMQDQKLFFVMNLRWGMEQSLSRLQLMYIDNFCTQKKDVVYGLLFLLHDLAGLESRNPTRNPPTFNTAVLMCLLVAENQLRCFVRHNQRQKTTLTSSCAALKSWNILQLIHLKLTRQHSFRFRIFIWVNI